MRIEHLVCACEARLVYRTHMQLARSDDAVEGIGRGRRVRLVDEPLVTLARGTRLVGIDARHDADLVLDLGLYPRQAHDVIHDRVLVVCRAGPDDQDDAIVFPLEDALDLFAAAVDELAHLIRERVHLFDGHRDGKLALKGHVHLCASFYKITLCEKVISNC